MQCVQLCLRFPLLEVWGLFLETGTVTLIASVPLSACISSKQASMFEVYDIPDHIGQVSKVQ